jgi:hypothetical protein
MSVARSMHWVGGVGLVAFQVAVLLWLARSCQMPALSVLVRAPLADNAASLSGTVPAQLRQRVEENWEAKGPGLVRKRWSISRRGNQQESVAATQLVGPFQDPSNPPCSGRVVVGQQMLQSTNAATVLMQIAQQNLAGLNILGAGNFKQVSDITLQWAQLSLHPEDKALLGNEGNAYLRAGMVIVFDRVSVPLTLALMPTVTKGKLSVRVKAKASLDFGNRALQWVSDKIGGNRIATMFARKEIDAVLLQVLTPPPPVELPGGGTLSFDFCDQPLLIVDNQFASLPMSVKLTGIGGAPMILPPRFPVIEFPTQAPAQGLAIDLDLNAINAILFECWRQGLLDRSIADAHLDEQFNQDPLVQEFLTVRISAPRLALPPVLSVVDGSLQLGVETLLTISDPPLTTIGHAWASMSLTAAPLPSVRLVRSISGAPLGSPASPILPFVGLQQLALTCETTPGLLSSCYPLLSQAVAARAPQFNEILTTALGTTLQQLFAGNTLTAPGAPAALRINDVGVSTQIGSNNAVVRLSLATTLLKQ